MMSAPFSSYSSLVTHMFSNGVRQDNIDPPIQVEYYLSEGSFSLKSTVLPDREWMVLDIHSAMLGNRVLPPIR